MVELVNGTQSEARVAATQALCSQQHGALHTAQELLHVLASTKDEAVAESVKKVPCKVIRVSDVAGLNLDTPWIHTY